MEYIIILTCVFVSILGVMWKNLRSAKETIRNLTQANVVLYEEFEAELNVLREAPVSDPRSIFEQTLADFSNPSLIEEMYVACPSAECDREYLRIDQPRHICHECGTRFYELPMAA